MAVAPSTASTVVAIVIVSLLLRSMADPFVNQDFHFGCWNGHSISHPPILDPPKRSFFSGTLLLPLPSAKSHPPENRKPETAPFLVTHHSPLLSLVTHHSSLTTAVWCR